MLSERQIEIVNGSMLGDGYIGNNFTNPNCRLYVTQSQLDNDGKDKKQYLSWFVSEFTEFGCSIKSRTSKPTGIVKLVGKKSTYEQYVFGTKPNEVFSGVEKKWYVPIVHHYYKRRKIIPPDLKLTPLSVCIWFMDDGSLDAKRGNALFHTQGFSEEENVFLTEQLWRDVGIRTEVRHSKGKPRLFVGVNDHKKLIDLIEPHVEWDCFKYKLDRSYSKLPHVGENHSLAKLTESQVNEITKLRLAGHPVKELAEQYGVCEANISMVTTRRWQHQGIKFPFREKPRTTLEQKAKIKELRALGLTQSEIAKQAGVSSATVSRVCSQTL